MIAAYQTGQIEGLAGRVYRHGVLACPVGDGLCRNVLVPLQNNVRPDLVRDDDAVVGLVDLHRLLQLPPFPDTAAGVVRAAEYGHMDFLSLQLGVHILIVHPPDTVFVLFQRTVDDLVAVVVDAHRKADVGGAVEQYAVTGGRKRGQRRYNAAQNTVLLAVAIHDGCKIVLHSPSFFLVCAIPGPDSAPLTSINSIPRHPRTCKGIFRRTLL